MERQSRGSTLLAWPMGDMPLRFRGNGRGPAQPTAQRGSVGGSGRVLGPAVAAGKFSAYGFPSLGPGAGKVPVGACVLTRVLYARGGRMSRGGETLSFSRFTEPIFAFWVPLQFRTTKTHRHSFSFRRLLLLGTVLQSLCAAPSQNDAVCPFP